MWCLAHYVSSFLSLSILFSVVFGLLCLFFLSVLFSVVSSSLSIHSLYSLWSSRLSVSAFFFPLSLYASLYVVSLSFTYFSLLPLYGVSVFLFLIVFCFIDFHSISLFLYLSLYYPLSLLMWPLCHSPSLFLSVYAFSVSGFCLTLPSYLLLSLFLCLSICHFVCLPLFCRHLIASPKTTYTKCVCRGR